MAERDAKDLPCRRVDASSGEYPLMSADGENRARCGAHDPLCNAPKKQVRGTGAAVSAHCNQIDRFDPGVLHDLNNGIADFDDGSYAEPFLIGRRESPPQPFLSFCYQLIQVCGGQREIETRRIIDVGIRHHVEQIERRFEALGDRDGVVERVPGWLAKIQGDKNALGVNMELRNGGEAALARRGVHPDASRSRTRRRVR